MLNILSDIYFDKINIIKNNNRNIPEIIHILVIYINYIYIYIYIYILVDYS